MSNTAEIEVRKSISCLLSCCDGARTEDGQGFNKFDSSFARTIHIQPHWTTKQLFSAWKMLNKYKVQLLNWGIVFEDIPVPEKPVEETDKPKLSWNKDLKVFQCKAHYNHRNTMRSIPTSRFIHETKEWEISVTLPSIAALKTLEEFFQISPDALEVIHAVHTPAVAPAEVPARTNYPELNYDGEYLLLQSPFEWRDIAKSLPNRRWIAETKTWRYLPTAEVIDAFTKLMDEHEELALTDSARNFFNQKRAEQLAQREQKIAAKTIKEGEVPNIPVPLKTTPFDHQKRAFAISTTLDNSALLMEQGTGKTMVAIAAAGKRYLDGQVKKVLVICPKSVVPVWEAEFKKHADFPVKTFPLNQKHMSQKKETILSSLPINGAMIVVIVNYASAWRLVEELKAFSPDMVIADESQNMKNGQAAQSKGCTAIGDKAKYRLILTGTPVSQGPMDFFSQYKFLDNRVFGKSFVKFRNQYAIMGGYMNHEITGFKNLEELTARAHSIAFRVTKAEALDLPETTNQNLYAYLDESQKAYHEMETKMVTTLKEGEKITAPIVLTQMLRLQQICGGFLPQEEGNAIQIGNEKLNVFKEFLEDFPKEKKLVVVARFVPELKAIQQVCQQLGRTSALLYGATDNRGELVRKFQEETNPNILIMQLQTGGVGITLTAADTMIFYSMDFSYNNYEQCKARVHRIGQNNKVTYIHLLAKDTIDETILDAIQNKRDVAELVVDKMRHNSLF